MKKRSQPKTWQEVKGGLIRAVSEITDISKTGEGTKILYRASMTVRDRDLEVIDVAGWKWNTTKLPPHLFAHNSRDPESWIGKGLRVWKDATGLYYEGLLFDESPSPIADVARHVAWIAREHTDALSCSVGFIPHKWVDPDGRTFTIDAPGNSFPWGVPGRKYLEQELIENSAVPVPSLIEALAIEVRGLIVRAGLEEEETDETPDPGETDPPTDEAGSTAPPEPPVPSDPPAEETEFEKGWRALGIEPPQVVRPTKAGAVLSREQVDRLKEVQGFLAEFLASATPAGGSSTEGR